MTTTSGAQGVITVNAVRTACDDSSPGVSPALGAEEEEALCRSWRDHRDVGAAKQLLGSYVHLVAWIALAHRNRGVLVSDLIGEGYVGLMRAICRYDPACGTRFTAYATWWVQAAIRSVLRTVPAAPGMTTGSMTVLPPLHPRQR